MLIFQHSELDADKAIERVKGTAKDEMSELQFAKCSDIIEKAARHFLRNTVFTSSWKVAFTIFQIEKKLSGYTLIHPLERLFRKKLSAANPVNAIEEAWSAFEKQYSLELITNYGHASDVAKNGAAYFTAAGWIMAVRLSQKSD